MGRARVVVGSLLGAATIHLVFLACSGPRPAGDGGIVDAALDAMGVIGDAEAPDAHAQEAGSCACPSPPAAARTTFTGSVDLGSGPVQPRAEFSTASAVARGHRFVDATSGYTVTTTARFATVGTPYSYAVSCVVWIGGGTVRAPSACTVIEERDGVASWSGSGAVTAATVHSITDTEIDFSVTAAVATSMGTGRSITVSGMRWRHSQPAGGVIPPPAYQP